MVKSYFIVDDHEMLRNGIIGWLNANTDFKYAGDSASLKGAMDSLVQLEDSAVKRVN